MSQHAIVCGIIILLVIPAVAEDCDDMRDCGSCVRKESWSGESCRWCTQDESCHAFGAIFTNPCGDDDNIMNIEGCAVSSGNYSPDLAWKSVLLSAVAYSNDANRYLAVAFSHSTRQFDNVLQVSSGDYSGFTATWASERLIVVSFRGTDETGQLLEQAISLLIDARVSFLGGGVQRYFKEGFQKLWNDKRLGEKVQELASTYADYKILVTGHSLGGAIASLASTYLAKRVVAQERVMVYTFGMPRVGDHDYAAVHNDVCRDSWRITQASDPVPHFPTCAQFGCNSLFGPYHHGIEIYYSSRTSYGNTASGFRKCNGLLHNEDWLCANRIDNWATCYTVIGNFGCISDHKVYFGISVGTWWKD